MLTFKEAIGRIFTVDASKFKTTKDIGIAVGNAVPHRRNTDIVITNVSKKLYKDMLDTTMFWVYTNMMSYDAKRKEARIDINRPKKR
jgi:hypothetical protein